ncbi:MAG: hypothetical protein MZV70_77655 [Desulfobacterales bacterium]|nr:hypothetical protein [Desulfobacterales bacterium]
MARKLRVGIGAIYHVLNRGDRRGWFFGGTGFKEPVLEAMGGEMGEHHGGEERRETDAQQAQRLVLEELRCRGWTEEDLERGAKRMARRCRWPRD